ncbi:hypothetical protein BJX66DRAFT_269134 [Aspergillus keveii]|jgi:hypothetical protein|uniref:Uncharacterized protein n=1 Tax=Aspergillus keveii TaxID=714993 RepID=A0ABR4FXJ7_9EURO
MLAKHSRDGLLEELSSRLDKYATSLLADPAAVAVPNIVTLLLCPVYETGKAAKELASGADRVPKLTIDPFDVLPLHLLVLLAALPRLSARCVAASVGGIGGGDQVVASVQGVLPYFSTPPLPTVALLSSFLSSSSHHSLFFHQQTSHISI